MTLDPGFGMEKLGSGKNIPDPQHWTDVSLFFFWCCYHDSLTMVQASLLIHRRRGEDERGDWVRLLDSSAASVRRLLATAAAGQHEDTTRQLRNELRNMVELVEMSGTAFRSREMEIILEAGLAVVRHMKVGKLNRLLFST